MEKKEGSCGWNNKEKDNGGWRRQVCQEPLGVRISPLIKRCHQAQTAAPKRELVFPSVSLIFIFLEREGDACFSNKLQLLLPTTPRSHTGAKVILVKNDLIKKCRIRTHEHFNICSLSKSAPFQRYNRNKMMITVICFLNLLSGVAQEICIFFPTFVARHEKCLLQVCVLVRRAEKENKSIQQVFAEGLICFSAAEA